MVSAKRTSLCDRKEKKLAQTSSNRGAVQRYKSRGTAQSLSNDDAKTDTGILASAWLPALPLYGRRMHGMTQVLTSRLQGLHNQNQRDYQTGNEIGISTPAGSLEP